jgi:hypothetical protein
MFFAVLLPNGNGCLSQEWRGGCEQPVAQPKPRESAVTKAEDLLVGCMNIILTLMAALGLVMCLLNNGDASSFEFPS